MSYEIIASTKYFCSLQHWELILVCDQAFYPIPQVGYSLSVIILGQRLPFFGLINYASKYLLSSFRGPHYYKVTQEIFTYLDFFLVDFGLECFLAAAEQHGQHLAELELKIKCAKFTINIQTSSKCSPMNKHNVIQKILIKTTSGNVQYGLGQSKRWSLLRCLKWWKKGFRSGK